MKKEEYPIEELPCGECEKPNKGTHQQTITYQYTRSIPCGAREKCVLFNYILTFYRLNF